jgi:hypothetical protein
MRDGKQLSVNHPEVRSREKAATCTQRTTKDQNKTFTRRQTTQPHGSWLHSNPVNRRPAQTNRHTNKGQGPALRMAHCPPSERSNSCRTGAGFTCAHDRSQPRICAPISPYCCGLQLVRLMEGNSIGMTWHELRWRHADQVTGAVVAVWLTE